MSPSTEPPLHPAEGPRAQRPALPWYRRAVDVVSRYLPLVLMALLALATWRLATNTPVFQGDKPEAIRRHVPDYTMNGFTVQRFANAGALSMQIEGDTLRHYPDTDTLEIDKVHIRSITPEGRVTLAWAEKAVSNGDGSEVQLTGNARVLREAYNSGAVSEVPISFHGEFLHVFLRTERLNSHLPVVITRDATEVRGDSMTYDNLTRVAQFKGRVRATFPGSTAPLNKR